MSNLLPLFPVQSVVLKAIFGAPLDDDPRNQFQVTNFDRSVTGWYTEASYLRSLYDHGRSSIREVQPYKEHNNVCLSLGRRSGKSVLIDSIARTEAYKGGREILIISVTKESTSQIRDEVSNSVDRDHDAGWFQSYNAGSNKIHILGRDWKSGIHFHTNNKVGCGTTYDTSILDEFDHFPCPEAVLPCAAKRRVMISTPRTNPKDSWFERSFKEGMEGSDNTLSLQIPTWEMNSMVPAQHFKSEKARDSKTFDAEYGAFFPSQTRSPISIFRKV